MQSSLDHRTRLVAFSQMKKGFREISRVLRDIPESPVCPGPRDNWECPENFSGRDSRNRHSIEKTYDSKFLFIYKNMLYTLTSVFITYILLFSTNNRKTKIKTNIERVI